ncbi:MAG: purine-nucleoside phosphorylase [Sphaerochaetaceae bacterium]|nr:purine-nucleoside phosphorylase [Sphaerochaetaceae bacterium]MDC7237411.1 purine-nucleoside phosphorylase [Sphaerochaetaceae bacterium]MDC7249928.1 purine-nucleoside phosphorylase [Sphaerochaetaceae bacterium]
MEEKSFLEKIEISADYIKKFIDFDIEIALVLGSGLGELAQSIENPIVINYSDIPNFPISTAPGHYGKLVIGEISGKNVVCMQGRFHYYEGYDAKTICYPIFVFNQLNIKKLILTNASGCLRRDWNVGDLMIIEDHIKLVSDNPLRGINYESLGPRFFDMSKTYSSKMMKLACACAKEINLPIRKGVYQFFSGPSFETAAEIKMASALGADATGMSTVFEAITASYLKMELLAISCLTNMATGISETILDENEVIEAGKKVKPQFIKLLKSIINKWEN